jgi:hypothetical protein
VPLLSCTDVDLDDFAFDEESGVYSHPCRCGALYQLSESMLLDTGVDLFACTQCSLLLRALFEWVPEVEEQHGTATAVGESAPTRSPSLQQSSSSSSSINNLGRPAAAVDPNEMG